MGPLIGRRLVAAAGGAAALWRMSPDRWRALPGVGARLCETLAKSSPEAAAAMLDQAGAAGVRALCPEDAAWPAALEACDDAPLVLFARGDVSALRHPRLLAVVGARRASREGRLLTRRWCRALARAGVGIVSGMAMGIDAAAHGGALEAASDAPTIAVLGCGLLAPFSPLQQRQIEVIGRHGCVLSELPLEAAPQPAHFPRRNRIIAGLSAGTLVMEAALRSGSLITARRALEYGREVLAVPGPVTGGLHAGCHQLIRDGAHLVESPEDVLRAMDWPEVTGMERATAPTGRDAREAAVLEALRAGSAHPDAIAEACGLTVPELSPILLALEMRGVVARLPGNRYTLNVEIRDS
ncbi:MAG: DNA-processing protein DprA [Mariprofundaceae bacterium]